MAKKPVDEHRTVQFRFALRDDVPTVVSLLVDDVLGAGRESADESGMEVYFKAFDEMESQGGNHYLLAVDLDDSILGCLQITVLPGLSRSGMKRAQIEGVRVARTARGLGIGSKLMNKAHAIAQENDCGLVQLTTDRAREDALRFYEALGYENSHHGLKYLL